MGASYLCSGPLTVS